MKNIPERSIKLEKKDWETMETVFYFIVFYV